MSTRVEGTEYTLHRIEDTFDGLPQYEVRSPDGEPLGRV